MLTYNCLLKAFLSGSPPSLKFKPPERHILAKFRGESCVGIHLGVDNVGRFFLACIVVCLGYYACSQGIEGYLAGFHPEIRAYGDGEVSDSRMDTISSIIAVALMAKSFLFILFALIIGRFILLHSERYWVAKIVGSCFLGGTVGEFFSGGLLHPDRLYASIVLCLIAFFAVSGRRPRAENSSL